MTYQRAGPRRPLGRRGVLLAWLTLFLFSGVFGIGSTAAYASTRQGQYWYTNTWHPGHWAYSGYWQPVWHPGYTTRVSHPGYSTRVWHPAYTTSVWHPGYSTTVWHPGYTTQTTHTTPGHSQSIWHPATTSTVEEPHTTSGYWKTVSYTVPIQEATWHTATVTQTYQIPVQKTVTGWHAVTQTVWKEVGSGQSGSGGTTYAIALPTWMQVWGTNPMAGQSAAMGGQSGTGGGSGGQLEPVEETTRVYGSYQTTVMAIASRQVTTQVPETVTVDRTEKTSQWVAPVTTEVPVTVTHPGYYTTTWIPPVTTTSPVHHPGYSTSVWHPGYSTTVSHPDYWGSVWHPGYTTTVSHPGYWARVWRVRKTWVSGYWTHQLHFSLSRAP